MHHSGGTPEAGGPDQGLLPEVTPRKYCGVMLPSYSPSLVMQMEYCHPTSSSLMTHITWRENGEKCMCMMTYVYVFSSFVYMYSGAHRSFPR